MFLHGQSKVIKGLKLYLITKSLNSSDGYSMVLFVMPSLLNTWWNMRDYLQKRS